MTELPPREHRPRTLGSCGLEVHLCGLRENHAQGHPRLRGEHRSQRVCVRLREIHAPRPASQSDLFAIKGELLLAVRQQMNAVATRRSPERREARTRACKITSPSESTPARAGGTAWTVGGTSVGWSPRPANAELCTAPVDLTEHGSQRGVVEDAAMTPP